MMNDYFFSKQQRSHQEKMKKSGSFGFCSSDFSQKNNNSINAEAKNMDPSFFNESSIRKLNNSESGEFIYFNNDSVLSELQLELKNEKQLSLKQQLVQKKKKQAFNYSKEIQFDDSLQISNDHDSSKIKEYGTGKSNLPPTLRKPKFAFKISQTAESSTIMKDVQNSIVMNQVGKQYQLKQNKKKLQKSKGINEGEMSKHSDLNNSSSLRGKEDMQKENTISSIKKPYQQPSVISKSLSQSNSLNGSMNFKSVFKHKIQKASVINSSLNKKNKGFKSSNSILSYKSLNRQIKGNDMLQKEVKIAELNDLRELQNKLGKLKHQNKKIIQYMIQKDQQIEKLQKKKIEIQSEDPYAIIKENELMKVFLNNKNKIKNSNKNITSDDDLGYTKCLRSAKSFKQISLKKSSQISSLHDYDITEHKFKVQFKQLTKTQKKMILSNRGILLSEKQLDVGYSLKDNHIALYFTFKKQYNDVGVRLEENSFILSDSIDRIFRDYKVGKQIKFKTEIKSTKCLNPQDNFSPLCLKISLSTHHKVEIQSKQFQIQLPITVYNISKQFNGVQNSQSIQKSSRLNKKEIFKTQTFKACKEMIQNPECYLMKLFPMGNFSKQENLLYIGFLWKQKQDLLRIRIKERSFVIEGEGNPNTTSFQLIRSIISLLADEKKDN